MADENGTSYTVTTIQQESVSMPTKTLHAALTERIDRSRYIAARMSWPTRVLLRLFARRLNREVFYPVVAGAYERGVIRSHELHELLADFDPTQRGAVGLVTERRGGVMTGR